MLDTTTNEGNIPFISDRKTAYTWQLDRVQSAITYALARGDVDGYVMLVRHLEKKLTPFLKGDILYNQGKELVFKNKQRELAEKGYTKKQLESPQLVQSILFDLYENIFALLMDVMSRHGFLPYLLFEDEIDPRSEQDYFGQQT